MKKFLILISVWFVTIAPSEQVHWGFFGHKKINELAIYTLPEEMFAFYKAHMDYIVQHSVDPDKRRYGVKGEAERHYIDMDHYCADTAGCNPFQNVPRPWSLAVEKFTEDTLRANGIVPWHVYLMTIQLTEAFREENFDKILRLSAEMGHYVADAHVPLHTTSNYNGQKTDQRGIHAFWESRLPELYEPQYDFFVGKAEYVKSPLNFIWDRVEESFAGVDTVLGFEAELNVKFPSDQKYAFEDRGQTTLKTYSREYSQAYHEMLDNQVERRMKRAVLSLGSLWYTCWVNAGQPDLNKWVKSRMSDEAIKEIEQENEVTTPGLKVREHDN